MKIASAFALDSSQRALIQSAAPGAEIVDRQCKSAAEVVELASGGCDVIMTFLVPDDLLSVAPGLKWIQLFSAGADHMIDGQVAKSSVKITTTSGVHAVSIAEFIMTMILMHAHRFNVTNRAQYRHEWLNAVEFMKTADSIRGKTIGLIGYGSIGRETARIASAMGLEVLALKRNPRERMDFGWSPAGVGDPRGEIPRLIVGPDERLELIRRSDYIVVTLPLTPATRSFIGRAEIAAMKPTAFLVNVGRGPVVDQTALVEALGAKRIGGAGLDVFEVEPLPKDSPLWDFEEVILTPHMAGPFRGYQGLACELFAENLRRFVNGQPLLNEINRDIGY
jgi:phosphoglycerate dehydrogenase-like enzyme